MAKVVVPIEIKQTGKGFSATVGQLERVEKRQKQVNRGFGEMSRTMQTGFGQIALAAGSAYGAFRLVTGALEAQSKQVDAINRLNLALANQGNYSSEASRRLQEYASALQQTTAYGDEVILQAQALAATFGMNEEQLRMTTAAALDFAAATGRDLTASINLLGKAFVGETGELSRYGIIIDKNIPKSEKFDAVIKQMSQRFGGQAQAATKTFSGQVEQLGNTFGDVQESLGKLIAFMSSSGGNAFGGLISAGEWLQWFFGEWLILKISDARILMLDMMQAPLEGALKLAKALDRIPGMDLGKAVVGLQDQITALDVQMDAEREAANQAASTVGQTMAVKNVEAFNKTVDAAAEVTREVKETTVETWKLLDGTMKLPEAVNLTSLAFDDLQLAAANTNISMQELPEAVDYTNEVFTETVKTTFDWSNALNDVANQFSGIGGALGSIGSFIADMTRQITGMGAAWQNFQSGRAAGGGGLKGILNMVPGIGGLAAGALGIGKSIFSGLKGLFGGESEEDKRAREEHEKQIQNIRDDLGGAFGQLASQTSMASADFLTILESARGTAEATEWIAKNLDVAAGGADKISEGLQYLSDPDAAKAAASLIAGTIEKDVFERGIGAAGKYAESLDRTIKTLEDQGIDTSKLGLGRAKRMVALSQDERVVGLSGVAQGLGETIQGQLNAGVVDDTTIRQSAVAAQGTLDELKKAGLTDREAYLQMTGYLSAVKAASEASGTAIPEEVRNMIAEAERLGITITGDQGLATTNTLLKQILQAIGAGGGGGGGGSRPAGGRPAGYPESMPWPPRGMLRGGRGDFGDGELVELHGREVVVPESSLVAAMSAGGGAVTFDPTGKVRPAASTAPQKRVTVNVQNAPAITIQDNALVRTLEGQQRFQDETVGAMEKALDQNTRGMKTKIEQIARNAIR